MLQYHSMKTYIVFPIVLLSGYYYLVDSHVLPLSVVPRINDWMKDVNHWMTIAHYMWSHYECFIENVQNIWTYLLVGPFISHASSPLFTLFICLCSYLISQFSFQSFSYTHTHIHAHTSLPIVWSHYDEQIIIIPVNM